MSTINDLVHSDPDILGGTPVLIGTRVHVRTLLDYLAAGDSLEVFLDHFPNGLARTSRRRARAGKRAVGEPCAFCLMSASHGPFDGVAEDRLCRLALPI